MSIFKEIEQSIYSPEYYDKVLRSPISFSLRYYLYFSLVIALIATAVLSLSLVPRLYLLTNKIGTEFEEYYPADLKITVRDGQATANVKQPYFLPFPDSVPEKLRGSFGTSTKHLLAIDTRVDVPAEKFASYEAALVLAKDKLMFNTRPGRLEIQSLSQLPPIEITKASLADYIELGRSMMKFLAPLLVLLMFLMLLVVLGFNLVYLLLAALLVWLVAKARGYRLGYLKSYQVGLHAITASVLLDYLMFLLFPAPSMLLIPTLVMLLVVALNLRPSGQESLPLETPSQE